MSYSGLRVGLTGNIGSGKSTIAKIFELLHVPVYYADERAKRLMVEREDIRQRITDIFGEEVYSFGLQSSKAGEADQLVGRGGRLRPDSSAELGDQELIEEEERSPSDSSDQRNKNTDPDITNKEINIRSADEPAPASRPGGRAYQLNRAYLADQVFKNPEKLALLNGIVHPAVAEDSLAWHEAQTTPYTLYEAAITFETGGYKLLDATILVTAPRATRLSRVMARDGSNEEQVQARMDRQWPEEKKIELADHRIVNDGKALLVPQVLRLHEILTR